MPQTDRHKTQDEIDAEYVDYMTTLLKRFERVADRLEVIAGIVPGTTIGEEDSNVRGAHPSEDAPDAAAATRRL